MCGWGSGIALAQYQPSPTAAQVEWSDLTELRGNTVYDPATLIDFAAGFVEQQEGAVTVSALAAAVERVYREDGLFLARVHASADMATGRPMLTVDEGVVTRLEVRGVPVPVGFLQQHGRQFRQFPGYRDSQCGRNGE
jgi:hemolysin activation/secretion protein